MKRPYTLTLLPCLHFFILFLVENTAQAQTSPRWQTDNTVYSSLMVGDKTLFIGGNFNYVGKHTGAVVAVPMATPNVIDPKIPVLEVASTIPSISAIVGDGSGGYFVASGSAVVHYKKTVFGPSTIYFIDWATSATSTVTSICLSSSGTLYMGGSFISVTGPNGTATSRRYLAALNPTTGNPTTWNANLSAATGASQVNAIVASGTNVYIGGNFKVGATVFTRLAALSETTALPVWGTANDPDLSVTALALSGSTLYVAGNFSKIGATTRKIVAAVSASNGSLIPAFDPDQSTNTTNGSPRCLLVSADGSVLYMGGSFSCRGQSNLVALSTVNGVPSATWLPQCTAPVNALVQFGTSLYVGGEFASTTGAITIGGQSRNYMAVINTGTGLDDDSWVTRCNAIVKCLTIIGSSVFMGGDFTSVGGEVRNRAAAIDYSNNVLLPWNPDVNNTVYALAMGKKGVILGGDFTTVNGQNIRRIASVDPVNGVPTAGWAPQADGTVRALYASNGLIYAGGDFSNIGVQPRSRIAKIDEITAAVDLTWNPGADATVRTITGFKSKIIAGGDFTTAGSATRNKIAAFDPAGTGATQSWYPAGGADQRVLSLAGWGDTLYAGGEFTTIGGQSRKYLAAIDAAGATITGFNANPNSANRVNIVFPSGPYLYAGGSFNDMQTNLQHKHLAEVDRMTGQATTTFYSNMTAEVFTLAVNGTTMYYGGSFITWVPDNIFNGSRRNLYLSFHMTSGGSAILPVKITNFSVLRQSDNRLIRWQFSGETTDPFTYEVQRAASNSSFATLFSNTVDHFSATEFYETSDNAFLLPGVYNYRLKIRESNGRISYSDIRSITISGDACQVFPTVVSDGRVSVSLKSTGTIYVRSSSGQTVGSYLLHNGINTLNLNNLARSVYYYDVIDNNGAAVKSGKLVVR